MWCINIFVWTSIWRRGSCLMCVWRGSYYICKAEAVADCLRDGLILCLTQLESRLSDLHLKHLCQSHHAPACWKALAQCCLSRCNCHMWQANFKTARDLWLSSRRLVSDIETWDLITTEQIWFEMVGVCTIWYTLWLYSILWVHFVWSSRHDGVYESLERRSSFQVEQKNCSCQLAMWWTCCDLTKENVRLWKQNGG